MKFVHYAFLLFSLACLISVITIATAFYRGTPALNKYVYIADKVELSKNEQYVVEVLLNKGAILPPEVLQSSISGYYNALLTMLTVLLTLFTAISVFYNIKYSRTEISKMIHDEFIELSDSNIKVISNKVSGDVLNEVNDSISVLEASVSKSIERLDEIENEIMKNGISK
ncbi:hypothetical protein [Seleniivibrio woodruffii]|uniref:hypothetical protein n=1 Tax=Seleniivibrio woodruffii TaxID=1078050 RepID=UPI00240A1ECA|nr:hypothetical protein [Seleniivibrio woodruffii]